MIVLIAAAFLAAVRVNESFALPLPTPDSEACDADSDVWPTCVIPEVGGGELLTGTVGPGAVGLNVTS